MKYKTKAFTLTELLIALGIIGAIAAISIPSLMNTINNRMLVSQLKSNITSLQQIASEALVVQKVKTLEDTDFNDSAKLLTVNNFAIQRTCTNPAVDCWGTEGRTNPIVYKTINKTTAKVSGPQYSSVILKNGTILGYKRLTKTGGGIPINFGDFCFDVNGQDYPNIVGRDYFCVYVSYSGILTDFAVGLNNLMKLNQCKNGDAHACYGVIVDAGWTMSY